MNKTHTVIIIIVVVLIFSVVFVTAQPNLSEVHWLQIIANKLQNIADALNADCEWEKLNQQIDFDKIAYILEVYNNSALTEIYYSNSSIT